jgi:hypothetical protein
VGTEWFKGETKNPWNFIVGTVRRYFATKYIRTYYFTREKIVLPYLDSEFLSLLPDRSLGDLTSLLLLYYKFSFEMLNLPFCCKGQLVWVNDKQKEELAELAEK